MEQRIMGKNCSGFIVSEALFLLFPRLLSMPIFHPCIILFFLVAF